MRTAIASAALLSVAAVSAIPAHFSPNNEAAHGGGGNWGHHGGNSSSSHSSGKGQIPFKFPLNNGFPNIKVPSAELTQIEQQAHGTLPDGPLSKTLAGGDVTIFELIAFNELFEVAFFTSLISNITHNVPGYGIGSAGVKSFVLKALIAIQAQEELHAIGANGILAAAGHTPIQPCEYKFPSDSFDSAIDFARTFTDLVLGTLQDALNGLATNGDDEYIPLIGSVIGQEGEQNGYYRTLLDLNPSELPFLTRSAGPFAFSALNQNVIVPKSCPNEKIIDLPIFGALTVDTKAPIQGKNQNLEFSFSNTKGANVNSLSVVYINQQNLPIVEKPKILSNKNGKVKISAALPFTQHIMNGLTLALVTSDPGPFQTADDVAAKTLFGPGLIEIN